MSTVEGSIHACTFGTILMPTIRGLTTFRTQCNSQKSTSCRTSPMLTHSGTCTASFLAVNNIMVIKKLHISRKEVQDLRNIVSACKCTILIGTYVEGLCSP